jgi:hypothetical protein
MNPTHRIIICGQSIFLMAIEAGLSNRSELEVIRLQPHSPDVTERIAALKPNLVVVEQNSTCNQLILALLSRDLALVELNEKGQGTLLTRRDVSISNPTDLTRLIEQVLA